MFKVKGWQSMPELTHFVLKNSIESYGATKAIKMKKYLDSEKDSYNTYKNLILNFKKVD